MLDTLTTKERRRLAGFVTGTTVVLLVGSFAAGASVQRLATERDARATAIALSAVDPVRTSPVIPACKSDDFNDGTQSLCYTVTVTGQVVVLDESDNVVSTR